MSKMIHPQLNRRVENIPKKTRYFDPKTCSQCIVVIAPYPSSLGGVYQPVETQRETPLPIDPYHCACEPPPKYQEIFTHHSFHESAQGICTTVVLGQDCTGSEEQITFFFFRCAENAGYAVKNYNNKSKGIK